LIGCDIAYAARLTADKESIPMQYSIARILPVLTIPTALMAAVASYIGIRLMDGFSLHPVWQLAAWTLLMLPAAFIPAMGISATVPTGKWMDGFLSLTYLALGLFSFLFVFTVARDLLWVAARGIDSLSRTLGGDGGTLWPAILPADYTVLQAWNSIANRIIIILSAVLFLLGAANALRPPKLVRVNISIENLHPDLERFRIAQLSDIHLGPFSDGGRLNTIIEKVNGLSPDMVAITGDLVDGPVARLGNDARLLTQIDAPVFFVHGNHESYWGPAAWTRFLTSHGIDVLVSEHRLLRKGRAEVLVAGVPDLSTGGFQRVSPSPPETALAGAPPADFRLLLAHQPGSALQAAGLGYDLQLSGHTHGGQFFPWNLIIDWVQPFATGLHRHKGMWIYTSRGTGSWGPPVRLGSPTEITLIELKSAD